MNEGIDSTYGYDKVKAQYPQLVLKDCIDELGILLEDLRPGTVTVCIKRDGRLFVPPIKIHKDIETLATLANIHEFTYREDAEHSVVVKSVDDLIDASFVKWDN